MKNNNLDKIKRLEKLGIISKDSSNLAINRINDRLEKEIEKNAKLIAETKKLRVGNNLPNVFSRQEIILALT